MAHFQMQAPVAKQVLVRTEAAPMKMLLRVSFSSFSYTSPGRTRAMAESFEEVAAMLVFVGFYKIGIGPVHAGQAFVVHAAAKVAEFARKDVRIVGSAAGRGRRWRRRASRRSR
jgi:hypothetical protein